MTLLCISCQKLENFLWLCSYNNWRWYNWLYTGKWPSCLSPEYRNVEGEFMLQINKTIIPSPSRDDMMIMIATAWVKLNVNHTGAYKSLFVTNSLDGSEDYLVLFVSNRLLKVYFRYKKIISQNVPSEAQIKNFFIS